MEGYDISFKDKGNYSGFYLERKFDDIDNIVLPQGLEPIKDKPIIVEKGLSDSKYTEIKSKSLKEGDKIISNYFNKK